MKTITLLLGGIMLLTCCSPEPGTIPKELLMEAVNDSVIWVKRDGKEATYPLHISDSQWGTVPYLLEDWMSYWEKCRSATSELRFLQLQDVSGDGQADSVVAEAYVEGNTCLIQHRILGQGLLMWNDTLRLTEADINSYYGNDNFARALGPYAFLFWAYEHRNFTRPFTEDPALLLQTQSPLFEQTADSLYWSKQLPLYKGHTVDAMDGRSLLWNGSAGEMQVYFE